jgi:hypothetical protein
LAWTSKQQQSGTQHATPLVVVASNRQLLLDCLAWTSKQQQAGAQHAAPLAVVASSRQLLLDCLLCIWAISHTTHCRLSFHCLPPCGLLGFAG